MKEKVILVTGASGGIGFCISKLLIAQGHKVYATTRKSDSEKINELKNLGVNIIELDVTSDEKKSSVAGIVIGLTLTFVHLIGINLTGTSVNPARSLAPATIMAIVGDTKAIAQVWVFIVAPFVGSVLAAFAYKFLNKETK